MSFFSSLGILFSFHEGEAKNLLGHIRNRHLIKMDQLIKPDPFDTHVKHVPLTDKQVDEVMNIKKVIRKKRRKTNNDSVVSSQALMASF